METPILKKALEVNQRLGRYYVAVLPARLLLGCCFSDRMKAVPQKDGLGYVLEGTQRAIKPERLKDIARYIAREDSAFPNSIILAANVREEDGLIEEDESKRWSIQERNGVFELKIPSASEKLAAIIDGQHRLFAFKYAAEEDHSLLDVELICAIFIDLPKPFQAQLFATINSTQKQVDKSETYELFGYNISNESEHSWGPDKLAVFLARKLNLERDSPFRGRIAITPETDIQIPTEGVGEWKISMATVVEGILKLISSNPKRDMNELLTPSSGSRGRLRQSTRFDASPMREFYLSNNDLVIYLIVRNYFSAIKDALWQNAGPGSFIVKTVGIQAQFDILKELATEFLAAGDISVNSFYERLKPLQTVDFASVEFRNASGAGRTKIKKIMGFLMGVMDGDKITPEEKELFIKLQRK